MDQAAPQGGQFNNPVFTPPFSFPPPPPTTKPQPASPSPSTHFSSQQAVMVDVAATKVETTSPSEVGEETQKSQIEEAEPKKFDELSLWGSCNREIVEENVDMNKLSFRKKVYYMVRAKGDRGMLPYLESIGVKPSSALLISRYLSSERLPVLIDKVNFVNEILFLSTINESLLGRNTRRMMMYLSITADDDFRVPCPFLRRLSFFWLMEARHGGLNMLGQRDASFPYLIESFPKLLLCSVENHFKPLIHFLELVGVPKDGISTILLSFPPIIFYGIEKDIKPKMRLEEKDIGKILLKYSWIISTSIQENYEKILTYFNQKKDRMKTQEKSLSWNEETTCSPILITSHNIVIKLSRVRPKPSLACISRSLNGKLTEIGDRMQGTEIGERREENGRHLMPETARLHSPDSDLLHRDGVAARRLRRRRREPVHGAPSAGWEPALGGEEGRPMQRRREEHMPGDRSQGGDAAALLLQGPLPQRALRSQQLRALRQQVRVRAAVLQGQVHGGGLRRRQLRQVRRRVPTGVAMRVRHLWLE
ncbi:mTERF domain-containing protein, mitochondrial [Canna indica]|uniref:mTERF domain-containing protein, mitochondrial n=1 Tax=Canna indica TaxID=4628 RepID=A0AAQ3K7A4_9LILI|nr:mTERF domain-containing protein, mitochondrial [Canna indica]